MYISVILAAYNEEKILNETYKRLDKALSSTCESYEIIFVNDGSTDNSLEILKKINASDNKVKIIDFSRNFGQQAAFTAGINYAAGECVILMDTDLQDPPELIKEMVAKWQQGYKIVYAVRKKRKENLAKKIAYRLFYFIVDKLSDMRVPANAGDFSLMDRKVIDAIKSMPERNPFIRGMRSWVGFERIGIEYEREQRYADKSKYTFLKLVKLSLDGIFFSIVPLHIISALGAFVFIGCIVIVLTRLFSHTAGARAIVQTNIFMLLLAGFQIFILGLIGEYVGRIYEESKKRPLYIIKGLYGLG